MASVAEMKKLLMARAMAAIPKILSLQNEGNSIERLYRKGLLTDDMHLNVLFVTWHYFILFILFHLLCNSSNTQVWVKELKAFVEHEIAEVQQEAAEVFEEGFSAHIWPQAMKFHQASI